MAIKTLVTDFHDWDVSMPPRGKIISSPSQEIGNSTKTPIQEGEMGRHCANTATMRLHKSFPITCLAFCLGAMCLLLQQVAGTTGVPSTPISMKSGLSKLVEKRLAEASELAKLEQEVEDYNAVLVASARDFGESSRRRRLICLPLDDRFDPPMGSFSHEHIQTGDKMSLPKVFWDSIQVNKAEVPWLFSVSRVEGVTKERVDVSEAFAAEALEEVVGGPLDFRAPPNYIFLPWWMMRALGLQPRDVVDVKMVENVPPGSMAKLRPHSSKFSIEIANPQAVLETELRHYSSLTKGSTIAFDYNSNRYWFDVVELRSAPRGEKQPMVKVQDCDIATDFLPAKDTLKKRKKRKSDDDSDDDE